MSENNKKKDGLHSFLEPKVTFSGVVWFNKPKDIQLTMISEKSFSSYFY